MKRSKTRQVIVLTVGAIVAMSLAGCGGALTRTVTQAAAAHTAAPNPSQQAAAQDATIGKAQAAKEYQAAVGPVHALGQALSVKIKTWSNSTTATQAARDAQPYERALTALRPKLLALADAYPAAANDLKALVTAFAPLQGDLASVAALNASNTSSWVQQATADANKTSSAAAIVRSDLGLPAPA